MEKQKILFSLEAVGGIMAECYSKSHGIETGGILIGPKENKSIITDFIPSTEHAQRSPHSYFQSEKDVKFLNRVLKKHQKQGLDIRGYAHKHPSGLVNLSLGDLNTCKKILESSNYKLDNLLIMCIITESKFQEFPLFTYITSLKKGKVEVKEAKTKVLPRHCILECLECF